MGMRYTNCAISMMFLAIVVSPAFAQSSRSAVTGNWLNPQLKNIIRGNISWEDVRHKMLVIYLAQDLDGGGISQSDFKLRKQNDLAKRRIRPISKWVSYDLDGSGDVTRTELESVFGSKARAPIKHQGIWFPPSPEQSAKILEKLVSKALETDSNRDGKITFEEALEHAKSHTTKARSRRYRYRNSNRELIPMSFDHDGNGIVSEAEFMGAVDQALADIDQDSDHRFSNDEINTLKRIVREIQKSEKTRDRKRRLAEARIELAARCAFPKASANAQIILFSAYKGEALSSATLGGDEVVVTTANIKIDSGNKPLYLVLTSSTPIIWQISGATDRVTRVVAGTGRIQRIRHGAIAAIPRVGVTGIPAERVFISAAANCMRAFSNAGNRQSQSAATQLEQILGRAPDIVTGRRRVSTVQIPSSQFSKVADYGNTVTAPKDGPTAPIWKKLLRLTPGGLVKIDPKSVVSLSKAKAYTVLPVEAGLAQLVDAGALQPVAPDQPSSAGTTKFIPASPTKKPNRFKGPAPITSFFPREFIVLKKMTYPAGLTGAHRTHFVLKPGVPKPDGSSGHSKIRE